MNNKASITSLMSAFGRAYIAENKANPVFKDNFAKSLMTDSEYETMKNHIAGGIDFFAPDKKESFRTKEDMISFLVETQIAPTPLARSRFCEDSLKTAVKTGTTQYINLGSGLDTFAFREKELMKSLTVFEVDHPKTQEDKLERLKKAKLIIPDNLKFVPMDFTKDNLKEKLVNAGFDINKKTLFSWLGVSYYMTEKQVENMFESISTLAPDGSSLIFDYADTGLLHSKIKRVQNMLAMAKAGGEPMRFCASEFDLMVLLDRHNFLIYENLSPKEIQKMYFDGRTDYLKAFEHISYCHAVLKGRKINHTKETILETALNLFSQNGYEGVSVRDISGKIGITQAALYKHYKNKRDIFDKILQRMEKRDLERAKEFDLPQNKLQIDPEKYKNIQLEHFLDYSKTQYDYWTKDSFASRFRKMLTIEQYRSEEMTKLYAQYLSTGPLEYVADIFKDKQKAHEFYSRFYFYIMLYDAAEVKKEVDTEFYHFIDKFKIILQ